MSAQHANAHATSFSHSHVSLPQLRVQTMRAVQSRIDETNASNRVAISTRLFGLLVTFVIIAGYAVREQEYYTPEDGTGYWMGIVGGVMMLSLVLYPLRKKLHAMQNWGSVPAWFQLHMVLGLLGPVLILYHANFQLGAANSNVAFFCMLAVALSGVFGRFIYVKINYTLDGELVTLQQLQKLTTATRDDLEDTAYISREIKDYIEMFETNELEPSKNPLKIFLRLITLGRRASWAKFKTMQILRDSLGHQAREEGWFPQLLQSRLDEDKALVHAYINGVQRLAEFRIYQRVFAWWHLLHIPLFIMLVITGIVHVIAVHMY